MYRDALHTPPRFRRASAVAIALFSAFCAASCAQDLGEDVGGDPNALLTVNVPDDFESGSSANWTLNNDGSNWHVYNEAGATNDFFQRVTLLDTTAWSDATVTPARSDATAVVSAMVRINAWETSTQNRVYLFARAQNTGSTDTLTGYMVSIKPDASIALERRGANKAMTPFLNVQWEETSKSWDPGAWNNIQIQVAADPVLANHTKIAMYVNGLFAGSYSEDSALGNSTGNDGFGTAGASADFDDVMVGDATQFDAPEGDIVPNCHKAGTAPVADCTTNGSCCDAANACVCQAVVPTL